MLQHSATANLRGLLQRIPALGGTDTPFGVEAHGGWRSYSRSRRITTETKSSYKTTELIADVVAVIGVLVAAAITDTSDVGTKEARFYVTPADDRLQGQPCPRSPEAASLSIASTGLTEPTRIVVQVTLL